MTTSCMPMTHSLKTSSGPWMTIGTQSPKSKELTEGDVPKLLLFADRDVIDTVRTTTASSVAEVAGRDPTKAPNFADVEVKRHRQGLRKDEMGASDVLVVKVFNLGNLARQTIQRQAEPRMLCLIITRRRTS